ncbi:MAG: BatA domain-containing protein [Planctomycetota bacterium]|nr:BatA domain-containing protein [Planctomycetota bacterium]
MTFLNPIFLIGLLSAAIPLIIHLSRSRRTKKIRFSTTRFLTDQFLRSYRMSRLKELWLLAARMALCALFAMALAQPLIRPSGQSFLLGGQSRTVVLVVDNSASMGYVEDGETLLEQAKRAAGDLLDGLREGDHAAIVFAGRRDAGPEVVFDEPTPELGDVRQAIDMAKVESLGTDLSRAVVRAEELVQSGSSTASREVYVLSDLQDAGWELLEEKTSGAADVNFFFVSIRPRQPHNLAVTAVQYAASRPMVGVPFSIKPHIRNQSDEVAGGDVELFIDDKKVGQQQIDALSGGRWATPTFYHSFDEGGWHSGYVQVADESLASDNRRYFAFEVLDSVKVLAVNGAPSGVHRLDEVFFLKAALGASATGSSPIDVTMALPDSLAGSDLTGVRVVILANVESLSSQAVEKLETFVDQGGSLLVFLGDKVNASFYNQTLVGNNRMHGGLLPGRLTSIAGDPSAETGEIRIGDTDDSHVVLAAFDDGTAGSLSSVTMKAVWDFEPGDSAVLMRTSTGAPLLCERSFGEGHVMLFASTCDRDWTNFPVRPAYLPWIYRLVGYLSQEPMGRQNFYNTGDSVPVQVSATEGLSQLLVKKPDGSIGNVGTTGDSSAPFAFDDTRQAGVYSMYAPNSPDNAQIFVANLESYESDLTYLDRVLSDSAESSSDKASIEQGIRDVLLPGRALVSYIDNPSRVAEASISARRGLRLWDVLLYLALAVALFEPWFANRISLRRIAKPNEGRPTQSLSTGRLRVVSSGHGRSQPQSDETQEVEEEVGVS